MLSNEQIRELKNTLDNRNVDLQEEIRQELLQSEDQHYIDLAGQVHDLGEASVADLLVDLQLTHLDRHTLEVRDIYAALTRIAAGTYGVCVECNVPIEFHRLKAYPTAKRCRPCQVEYENSHAGGGTPSL